MSPPFDQLDFLYTPSRDVAADARWFTEVLGGRPSRSTRWRDPARPTISSAVSTFEFFPAAFSFALL